MKRSALPSQLTGPRILLKRDELEHAQAMFAAIDSDRARLGEFLPWVELTRTLEDERKYLESSHQAWDQFEKFNYGIFLKDSYIGNIGAHTISWGHERCELGYWIAAPFEGKGLMSEAVKVLERALFDLGFHRIEIHCSSENLKSARVPERCGYRLEGTLREAMIERRGFYDTLIYGKLRSDS